MTTSIEYRDNIPVLYMNTNGDYSPLGNGIFVMGYYDTDNLLGTWSWAPNREGEIPKERGSKYAWCYDTAPFRVAATHDETGQRLYRFAKDRGGREYTLISANGGYVPVRHGTDPVCGNRLAQNSRIKIVYDAHHVRHPACEIDYAQHGFVLHGNSWWPVKNGQYVRGNSRIMAPYYKDYQNIFPQRSYFLSTLSSVLTFAACMFGWSQVENPIGTAIVAGAQVNQLGRNLEAREMAEHELLLRNRQMEYQIQKATIDALNHEDEKQIG